MKEHGTEIAAVCETCRTWMKVDIDALLQIKGPEYSLINTRGPCKIWQCEGLAFFMWSPGKNVPFRPLMSDKAVAARVERSVNKGVK